MRFPFLAFVAVMLAAISPQCRADDKRVNFVAPPLSSFNGKQWGSLKIGQTTFKEIRPIYETGTGYFARSSELTQAKNSPIRIDCLWYKDLNGSEILGAITVQFKGAGVGEEEIFKAFAPKQTEAVAEKPVIPAPLVKIDTPDEMQNEGEAAADEEILPAGVEALYQAGRYEQWRVLRFPERGVAAFQLRDGENVSTSMLLFATKEGIATLSQTLSSEYSPVEERIDPNEGKPKVADFGNVYVDYNLRDGNYVPKSWRDDLKDRIENATAYGTLRHRWRADGSYNLTVSGKGDVEDDGSYSVTANISATGPYGLITASGSGSSNWSRRKNSKNNDRIESAFRSAASQAMRNAEDSFAKLMNNSGPPPLATIRREQWSALVDTVRNTSGLAPILF